MAMKPPAADVTVSRQPEPDAPPPGAAPAADLSAVLLRSAPRPPQDPTSSGDSPFFGKGEATADHFRRRHLEAHIVAALPPTALEPHDEARSAMLRDVRLWLRVVPALRWRMKLAAAVLGQTSQRFLVDALDDAMAQGLTGADDPMVTRLPRDSVALRVKLAFWVDNGRRSAMRLAVEARDETQQAFLHAALAAHLRRFAPSGLLLADDADDGAEIIAFPKSSAEPTPPLDGEQVRQRQALAANLGFRVLSRNAS
jgi:hypothetical protein